MSEKTPIDIVRASREDRFLARDIIAGMITDFQELHGDRAQGDDPAIIGGVGLLGEQPVTVIAINRGAEIAEKLQTRNGSPEASGYRKALRLMQQADRFNRPIITFINTPGAFPG
ncbi:MAG: carboxyl transferase domain-containing protein, partial [Weissella cibaria]